MKKITLLTIAALAISFASCKKDRVCTCSTTQTDTSPAGTTVTNSNNTTTYTDASKKAGRRHCQDTKFSVTQVYFGDTYTTVSESDCTLS